jgi:hypothetical protein
VITSAITPTPHVLSLRADCTVDLALGALDTTQLDTLQRAVTAARVRRGLYLPDPGDLAQATPYHLEPIALALLDRAAELPITYAPALRLIQHARDLARLAERIAQHPDATLPSELRPPLYQLVLRTGGSIRYGPAAGAAAHDPERLARTTTPDPER